MTKVRWGIVSTAVPIEDAIANMEVIDAILTTG